MLRRAGPARRLALARSMTATAISLSRRALERAAARGNGESAGSLELRYVELVYGEELATRLAARLSEGTK